MRRRRRRGTPSPTNQASPVLDRLLVTDVNGEPASLRDLWRGCPAFLVLGGPSLNNYPLEKLQERGIVTLGVNNVAGHVRCSAFTMNDGTEKQSPALLYDPTIIKLLPDVRRGKTKGYLRRKLGDRFEYIPGAHIRQCPNVFFFRRDLHFNPETFLTSDSANGGNNLKASQVNGRPQSINTMHMALRLLHYLGVREVFCLGLDFQMDRGKTYAFKEHRSKGIVFECNQKYKIANNDLLQLRPILDAAGYRIYNCNDQSGCTAFPHVPFEKAYNRCRRRVAEHCRPDGTIDLFGWYDPVRSHGDASIERMRELRETDWGYRHPPENTISESDAANA